MSNSSRLFAEYAEVLSSPESRRELRRWLALAVGSLAIAGIFALLLATSRVPGIEKVFPWPVGFFQKGLVIHVVFSFVVWFLAVFGGLLHLAAYRLSDGAPRANALGIIASALCTVAPLFLISAALMDRGEATLNNYIPTIIDPLYYTGLALLGGGIGLSALRLLVNIRGRAAPIDTLSFCVCVAAVIYLVALVCFGLALYALLGETPSHQFNEDLFWGGGHVLQFLNATILLSAWYVLSRAAFGAAAPAASLIYRIAVVLLLASILPSILITFMYAADDGRYRDLFTAFQFGMGPPVSLVVIAIVIGLVGYCRDSRLPWKSPAFLCLFLSMSVFLLGGFLGFFVDGADTRTPAHYHGVIAGINLSMMGLFYVFFLPLLGRHVKYGKALFTQVVMFAGGQSLAAVGLFLAGGYGVPRKTAGAEQGLSDIGAMIGMYMNGVGALIAVIGGVMFIFTVAAALLRKPSYKKIA